MVIISGKSREAYQNRLYYHNQIVSKMDYANRRYWDLDKKINKLKEEKYQKLSYNSKPTRKAELIQRLEEKRDFWDRERWQLKNVPKSLRGMIDDLY